MQGDAHSGWESLLSVQLSVGPTIEAGQISQDDDGKPVFPKLPQAPGVYFLSGPNWSFIGQTGNLRNRMGGYRNWKKRETHPVLFDSLRSSGGRVSYLTEAQISGLSVDLTRRDGREMIEALLRYVLRPTLNIDGK